MSGAYFSPTASVCNMSVLATMQRRYDTDAAPWRVMVMCGPIKASTPHEATSFPMAPAVVDDFGQLVFVGAWQ